MAFTALQYYGEGNKADDYNVGSFYTDEALTSYAFTTGAAYAYPYADGALNVLFDIALGSFSSGTTYYGSRGRQLTQTPDQH